MVRLLQYMVACMIEMRLRSMNSRPQVSNIPHSNTRELCTWVLERQPNRADIRETIKAGTDSRRNRNWDFIINRASRIETEKQEVTDEDE